MSARSLVTAASVAAVLRHPTLWGTAARAVVRLAARGWWRRWPPVPMPDPAYVEWRRQTAYGDLEARAGADDLVSYLEFCRSLGRSGA